MAKDSPLDLSPAWFSTPFGARVLSWETAKLRQMSEKVFGLTALKMGIPIDALQECAVSGANFQATFHTEESPSILDQSEEKAEDLNGKPQEEDELKPSKKDINIVVDPQRLPFHAGSIDVIMANHVLEMHDEPSALLREWNRVLSLDGCLLITLFNPYSALRFAPWMHHQFSDSWKKLTPTRLKDWLQILGLSIQQATVGVYCPPFQNFPCWMNAIPGTASTTDKHALLDKLDLIGNRWLPSSGSVLVLVAQKRVAPLSRIGRVRAWSIHQRWQTTKEVTAQTMTSNRL